MNHSTRNVICITSNPIALPVVSNLLNPNLSLQSRDICTQDGILTSRTISQIHKVCLTPTFPSMLASNHWQQVDLYTGALLKSVMRPTLLPPKPLPPSSGRPPPLPPLPPPLLFPLSALPPQRGLVQAWFRDEAILNWDLSAAA